MNWVLPKGVKLSDVLTNTDYKPAKKITVSGDIYLWDSNNNRWVLEEEFEPPTTRLKCECGVKFTGGLHSDWCPVNVVEAETQRSP